MEQSGLSLPKLPHFHVIMVIAALWVIILYGIARLFYYPHETAQTPLIIVTYVGLIPLTVQIVYRFIKKDFGADLLAILALITAALLSEYLAAVFIILMLSGGQVLEAFAMRRASSVLLALAKRLPTKAHRKVNGTIEEINLGDICIGDMIVIHPHDVAPVDGTVVEGHGRMDESYLTGEPYQISKAPGTQILSGAINGETMLVIRADKLAKDSRYATIMQVMEEAEEKRPHLRRIGDKLGAYFTPLALCIALVTWYFSGDPIRFLAVLVIATPCPLLIAIPVTIISAISMAAKRSIIIRDPRVLEYLPTCRTAIFDKTGTLTYGRPELTSIIVHGNHNEEEILKLAASMERYSKHPLANAILQEASNRSLFLLEISHISEPPGQGLTASIDGYTYQLTHRHYLTKHQPELALLLPPVSTGLECILLVEGKLAATFRFRDSPRKEGKSFIHHLGPKHHFNKIMLVSGDRATEVEYLASILGIQETYASQTPEQKVAIVRHETSLAPTLFMGDGINDAPALATATVGLAFGQHSSVTSQAAGAVLIDNTLTKVDELMHLSIALRRIALQSAVGGMVLSIIGMGLASVGLIPPVMGAILQEVIDVIAILNALRLSLTAKLQTDMES